MVKYMNKKDKKNNILFLIIPILLGISYLVYNIIISLNEINNVYIILNGIITSLIIITIGLILYIKNESIKKMASVIIIIFILLLVDLNIGTSLGFIKLPQQKVMKDFTNKNITEVIKWTSKNNIELKQIQEFSDTVDENIIISQSVKENTLARKIKEIQVTVSKGANPDTKVELKNMTGMNIDDAVKEIKRLKLTNVQIEYSFQSVERDEITKQSKEGKINRNEEVVFEVSLGEEDALEPVKLINLKNKSKFDATLWLKRNGIKYEIKYEFSDKVKKDHVISTNPKENTVINQKETTLELILSKGAQITVPDLEKMSLEKIMDWANKNNIIIKYNSEYDDKIKKGKIKYISAKKGDKIEEGTTIYITTSLGTLKMINTSDINKIREFANNHNIAINETTEYSDSIEKGQIIDITPKQGEIVNSTDTINVIISLGKSITVPNFVGMTLSKAKSLCTERKLQCTTVYRNSNKNKDIVIGQNKSKDSNVIENTNVILYVSNGKKEETSNSNNNSNNNRNNTTPSNGNNNSNNNNQPSCDTSKKTVLNIQTGSNGNETKSIISNMNPNVKFNWNMVNSCPNSDTTPGTVCNGNVLDGKTVDYCTAITITIVK